MHGDQFDAVVRGRSLGVALGGFACRRLLTLNRFVHWLHDLLDLPYWSLAQHVKARFPGAQGYIERYQNATLAAARAAQVDGVVCGHIHRAAFTEVDGLLYCNDGDWVESCTALVEDQRGELSLLEWRPTAATIAAAAVSAAVWTDDDRLGAGSRLRVLAGHYLKSRLISQRSSRCPITPIGTVLSPPTTTANQYRSPRSASCPLAMRV